MSKYRLLFTVLILSLSLPSVAQRRTNLTGIVIDAAAKSGIQSASVVLAASGGKVIDGALTDTTGKFTLKNVAPGAYQLKVDFVGYKTLSVSIAIKGSPTQNLGNLALQSATASLEAVTVTGSRPLVENHLDKIIYNVANDVTSQSGVALDVLKKVPMVAVDIDGNVELEGNSNIRFLINGKPSTMFGASLADALQSIPASQIKSIEVIASPGAKYDASGTGGIINIVLKDNRVKGVNGSLNLSAGTRLENGSFNFNLRQPKFGVSAFFSGNEQLNTTTLNSTDRRSTNSTGDTVTDLIQDGSSAFRRRGYQTGLTFDWDISRKDKLTAGFTFNHFDNSTTSTTSQDQQAADAKGDPYSSLNSVRYSGSVSRSNTADFSLDYKKTFHRKDQELEFLATTSFGRNYSNYYQQQVYDSAGLFNSGSQGNSPGTNRETDLQLDYRQPFSDNFSIETGLKTVLETLNSTNFLDTLESNGTYGPNANQTYSFNYNRQVYAGYFSAEFALFHQFLKGQAGLRYEYTHTGADFAGATIPDYGLFFPSIVLTHSFDDNNSVKASYSHRIERPDYRDLNPFYDISDPHNIGTGNPGLRPEKGFRYELGYNHEFRSGGSLYVGATYRRNTDDIQSFATYYPTLTVNGTAYTDVTLTERYNIGYQSQVGANIFGSVNVSKALSLRTNIQLGSQTNSSPGIGTGTSFRFRGNLNASYRLSGSFVAEVFGNYNSSSKTIQGTRPAFAFYTIAARKEFWHKKASLGVTATNPFTKYIDQRSELFGSNFTQSQLRRVPYQSFGLTLSYRFGKLEFKSKDRDNGNEPAPVE